MYGLKYGPEICAAHCTARKYSNSDPSVPSRNLRHQSFSDTVRLPADTAGSSCDHKHAAETNLNIEAARNTTANTSSTSPYAAPTCNDNPAPANPSSVPPCPSRVRRAKYCALIRRGTTLPIQVFHDGELARPAPQYIAAARDTSA